MPPTNAPLTRDRILATAEDVIRRFGPAKATVVDVARALGVSHAAVYRHVATKAALRDLVVGRWVEWTMPPLRAIAAKPGPAPRRLRRLIDALDFGATHISRLVESGWPPTLLEIALRVERGELKPGIENLDRLLQPWLLDGSQDRRHGSLARADR